MHVCVFVCIHTYIIYDSVCVTMCVNMCVSVVCMCVYACVHVLSIFHIAGKVGRGKFDDFDESFVIHQTKNHPNLVLTIISNYLFS